MNFFTNPFGARREVGKAADESSTPQSQGASFNQRIKYVDSYHPDTALAVGAYYRAVALIAEAISMMPLQYLIKNSKNDLFSPAIGNRGTTFHRLLNIRPNRFMTAVELKKRAAIHMLNKGRAVIYIQRDGMGEPSAFYLVESATWNPLDETWFLQDTYQKIMKTRVPEDDVIVWNNTFIGMDGFGISTIAYAKEVLTQSRTLTEEGITRVATGGRTKGIISNNTQNGGGLGKYKKEQLKNAKSDLQEQIDNGYDLFELAGDVKYTPMSMTAADLQFMEQAKFAVADVARFTGVPLSLLMEQTNQNYKSGESSDLQFYTHCLAPHIEALICELNCKLIIPSQCMTQKIIYDHSILHHMDMKTMGEYEKIMVETGQMSPNDLRRKNNLPPVEGGDAYYVSTNLAVLNSPKLTGEQTQTPPNVPPTNNE